MRLAVILFVVLLFAAANVSAQQAASSSAVPSPTPTATPEISATSSTPPPEQLIPDILASPAPAANANPSAIPDLRALDQAFHSTSLGKEADEAKWRIESRKLQLRVNDQPDIVAALTAANTARVDADKRELLRQYYELLYGRMRALTSDDGLRKFLDTEREQHITAVNQPRVRPMADVSATPFPKRKTKKKSK